MFIDTEEDIKIAYEEFIQKFLVQHSLEFCNLIKNKSVLIELVSTLHDTYHLSLRCISNQLNISRETLRKYSLK